MFQNKIRFWCNPLFVLFACSLIVLVSHGIRHSFGLFMLPITSDLSWGRAELSVALATQNLMIGLVAPFAGALAAHWGAARTIALGGAVFALGILIMRLKFYMFLLQFSHQLLNNIKLHFPQ